MRQFIVFIVVVGYSGVLRAQSGQFDNIVLDGGSLLPFIAMQKSDFSYLIAGLPNSLAFSVDGDYPFKIDRSADEDALILRDSGAVVRKSLQVDITGTGFFPALRIKDEDSNQVAGMTALGSPWNRSLFIGGFSDPYAIQITPNAVSPSITLDNRGVGIGIGSAVQAPLHVFSLGGTSDFGGFDEARVVVENASTATAVRDMFELVNNGGSRFTFTDTSIGSRWEFSSNGTGAFSISKAGTGGSEMRITPSGRVIMGPGGAANMDLRPNGDMIISGTLVQSSDRNRKKNLKPVDTRNVLDRLAKMPVYTWQFDNEESGVTHMGPTAQDFRAAFGLGYDDKSIAPVDTAGASLAGIKALNQKLAEKNQRIERLEVKINRLTESLLAMERRLEEAGL